MLVDDFNGVTYMQFGLALFFNWNGWMVSYVYRNNKSYHINTELFLWDMNYVISPQFKKTRNSLYLHVGYNLELPLEFQTNKTNNLV